MISNNWIYALLSLSLISAILALSTSNFIFKSGTAGMGIVILLILHQKKNNTSKDTWFIVGAFLFSIAGDWFLSNKNGDTMLFIKGIALFFMTHVGYLLFAKINGRINWRFTSILIVGYLGYFFLMLYPGMNHQLLLWASLIYLLVSCLSMGAAVGIIAEPLVKWSYVFGIFLVVFSDTLISLTEFSDYHELNFMILPTYYLAHISITFSLIKKQETELLRAIKS